MDLDFKQPFLELNRILEALHEQDLGPALEYVGLWVVPQGTGLVCSSRHPAYLTHLQSCLTGLTEDFGGPAKPPSLALLAPTQLASFSPGGLSPTGSACWSSIAPWSSSCTDCSSSVSWQVALRRSWRPSATPGTSSPLLTCTSVVRAQVLGWPLQHAFPYAARPHLLYRMPPHRSPPKKRLASTGAEGHEPETRSLDAAGRVGKKLKPLPTSRCTVMLATETALKPYFLTGF